MVRDRANMTIAIKEEVTYVPICCYAFAIKLCRQRMSLADFTPLSRPRRRIAVIANLRP